MNSKTAWFWRGALVMLVVSSFFVHFPWPMVVAAFTLLAIDALLLLNEVVK